MFVRIYKCDISKHELHDWILRLCVGVYVPDFGLTTGRVANSQTTHLLKSGQLRPFCVQICHHVNSATTKKFCILTFSFTVGAKQK